MPALFDTGALELLRRRHRRVESLAVKHYPPVICSQVAGEFLYGQFHTRASDAALVAARVFLAPFEMLIPSARTPDLCAELRARLQAAGTSVSDPVCWIAAHALEQGLPVVTTDWDFRRVPGLEVHLVVPSKGKSAMPQPASANSKKPGLRHSEPCEESKACANPLGSFARLRMTGCGSNGAI